MPKAAHKRTTGRFAIVCFVISAMYLAFLYGVAVNEYRIFPYTLLQRARQTAGVLRRMVDKDAGWYYRRVKDGPPPITNTSQAYPGLNLVTRAPRGREWTVEVMDMDGTKLHAWRIDWFRLWPDAGHVPKRRVPRFRPGTIVHGAVLMEDGDLVFNFDQLGLVRLDRRGEVVWRLPYQTHHSVCRHDSGNLWLCGQKEHAQPDARFPNRLPPFREYTILEVTPEGEIAEEWSVPELLRENGLTGLLHLGTLDNRTTQVRDDSLHLNDVEAFPDRMEEDFFKRGDVLVSLRNVNTVFAFNRRSREIKFICTGWFVRQHDPDFVDGNRFSVFDNNNIGPAENGHQSRIVIVSARERTSEVFFEGSEEISFYTATLGKHQRLPNGNVLITEAEQGRAFEINPQGAVVWQYLNYVEPELVGAVVEVQRLPRGYRRLFDPGEPGVLARRSPDREAEGPLANDTPGRLMR